MKYDTQTNEQEGRENHDMRAFIPCDRAQGRDLEGIEGHDRRFVVPLAKNVLQIPDLLAPPCFRSLVLKRVRSIRVVPATPVAPQPSSARTTTVCSVKGRGEVVNEIPLASAGPTFYGDRRCGFAVGGVVAGQASYTAMFNRARECLS